MSQCFLLFSVICDISHNFVQYLLPSNKHTGGRGSVCAIRLYMNGVSPLEGNLVKALLDIIAETAVISVRIRTNI